MIKLRSKKETQKSIAQISIKNNDGTGRERWKKEKKIKGNNLLLLTHLLVTCDSWFQFSESMRCMGKLCCLSASVRFQRSILKMWIKPDPCVLILTSSIYNYYYHCHCFHCCFTQEQCMMRCLRFMFRIIAIRSFYVQSLSERYFILWNEAHG